jgi:hypothetical protein
MLIVVVLSVELRNNLYPLEPNCCSELRLVDATLFVVETANVRWYQNQLRFCRGTLAL